MNRGRKGWRESERERVRKEREGGGGEGEGRVAAPDAQTTLPRPSQDVQRFQGGTLLSEEETSYKGSRTFT